MATRKPRVLITRSPHQASELADRLRDLGAEPVLIPAIEFAEPASFAALDAALARLDSFDWLLFTSANAVQAFRFALLEKRSKVVPQGLKPSCNQSTCGTAEAVPLTKREVSATCLTVEGIARIAAIGPSTARALEAIGLAPDLIPPQAVAESLAEALLPYARQPDGSPTRFLLVRVESGGDAPPREHLPATLRAAGADVTIAPAYRTVVPGESIPAIRELLSSPENFPDAITFTSSSTVRNLLALCEAAGVALPSESLRVSIGPITSRTLREAGLPPHAESREASSAALAETVIKCMQARPKL